MKLESQRGSFSVEALLVFTICFGIIAGGIQLFCVLYDWVLIESMALEAADTAAADFMSSEKGLYSGERVFGAGVITPLYQESWLAKEEHWQEESKGTAPQWLDQTRQNIRNERKRLLFKGDIQWSLFRKVDLFGVAMIAEISRSGLYKTSARAVKMSNSPVDFIRKVDLLMEQGGILFDTILGMLPQVNNNEK